MVSLFLADRMHLISSWKVLTAGLESTQRFLLLTHLRQLCVLHPKSRSCPARVQTLLQSTAMQNCLHGHAAAISTMACPGSGSHRGGSPQMACPGVQSHHGGSFMPSTCDSPSKYSCLFYWVSVGQQRLHILSDTSHVHGCRHSSGDQGAGVAAEAGNSSHTAVGDPGACGQSREQCTRGGRGLRQAVHPGLPAHRGTASQQAKAHSCR